MSQNLHAPQLIYHVFYARLFYWAADVIFRDLLGWFLMSSTPDQHSLGWLVSSQQESIVIMKRCRIVWVLFGSSLANEVVLSTTLVRSIFVDWSRYRQPQQNKQDVKMSTLEITLLVGEENFGKTAQQPVKHSTYNQLTMVASCEFGSRPWAQAKGTSSSFIWRLKVLCLVHLLMIWCNFCSLLSKEVLHTGNAIDMDNDSSRLLHILPLLISRTTNVYSMDESTDEWDTHLCTGEWNEGILEHLHSCRAYSVQVQASIEIQRMGHTWAIFADDFFRHLKCDDFIMALG